MSKAIGRHFVAALKRAEEPATPAPHAVSDADRLHDLELAVTRLAAAVTKEPLTEVTKLYATMLALKNVALEDVPVSLREDVQAVLDEKIAVDKPRKEVAR